MVQPSVATLRRPRRLTLVPMKRQRGLRKARPDRRGGRPPAPGRGSCSVRVGLADLDGAGVPGETRHQPWVLTPQPVRARHQHRRTGRSGPGRDGRDAERVRLLVLVAAPRHASTRAERRPMKGDWLEAVLDTGQGVQTFEIEATGAGRRIEATVTVPGVVEGGPRRPVAGRRSGRDGSWRAG